jgi:dihydrodipicolinate synthase/N-acetylneuraminate lyase
MLREGTVIPAIPLALKRDRSFDERRQRALLRYYLDAGAGGIAIAVHTTQFAVREYPFFENVLRTTIEEINIHEERQGKVIVKIGGVCGKILQAQRETRFLKSCGFDAVLLSPGGLADLSEEELLERTRAVAEILPVIAFYLQSAVGGRYFSYDYWEKLCRIPGVAAIKCAPFNRYMALDLIRAAACSPRAEEIALYTGNDDNILIDLLSEYRFQLEGKTVSKSFAGGLLGHWSVWTKSAVDIFNRIKEVRRLDRIPAELLSLAHAITDANGAIFDARNNFAGCIPGIHEILRRQGLLEGIWCLNPDETLSPEQDKEIDRIYRMYPELNDDAFVTQNLDRWLEKA